MNFWGFGSFKRMFGGFYVDFGMEKKLGVVFVIILRGWTIYVVGILRGRWYLSIDFLRICVV